VLLTPAQTRIAADRHRFRVVNCGRRFGKTFLAALEIAGKSVSKSGTRVAYIAPTYQQARDIIWRELKAVLLPVLTNTNESRLELTVKTQDGGEAYIWLRGWESVETLRGQRFDFVVIDEVAMMRNFWVNWLEVVRPTLTDSRGDALFLSTPKGYNHFFELYNLEQTDPDFKSFHFTTYDNPHIPPDEIDKAREQLGEDRFAQEHMADFRKVQGLVYKDFDRFRHVTDELPDTRVERIEGIDFGFTNPAAILTIDKDADSNYWVTAEWYKTQKTTPEIIEHARSEKPNAVYPDPAEPDRIEEMRRAGLNIREVSKDIEAGIAKVQELFRSDRIRIHSSCVNLISELESYSYPDKKPEHNEAETPIKENDHACDALRYALYMNAQEAPTHVVKQFRSSSTPTTYAPPRHRVRQFKPKRAA